MLLVIAPILASKSVLGGLHGEIRRIEDKFLGMDKELKMIGIRVHNQKSHGNMCGALQSQ